MMKASIPSNLILTFCLSFLMSATIQAAGNRSGAKPQWVSKGETTLNSQRTNQTYYFKVIQNTGPDLSTLRRGNTQSLAEYIGRRNQISGLEVTEASNSAGTSGVTTTERYQLEFKNAFSSDAFYAVLVDEYWETIATASGQSYQYYALYAVSADGNVRPVFDRFEVTRSYGAAPAVLSVIPGVGQLVKGQKLKGALMLSGAAVGAGAIILCENRRAYNATRVIEQPKFARHYNQKADNCSTGRNIAVGATAALVVWSVIDAAATPGVTRIKVSPTHTFSFRPTLISSPDRIDPGVCLALQF